MGSELILEQVGNGVQLAGAEAPRAVCRLASPLADPGWDARVTAIGGSFFHSRAWAQVLAGTYGHQPFYCVQQAGDTVVGVLPLMELNSPFLGRRGISLPFTDSCGALFQGPVAGPEDLCNFARSQALERGWRYLEFRGPVHGWRNPVPSIQFLEHVLPLADGADRLMAGLNPAVRRAIRKSSRAGLTVSFGTSDQAMSDYYRLHALTRKRHGLPPQPERFFQNIARYVFAAGNGFVASAILGGRTVAAAVFFFFGTEAVYKFGASDLAFQSSRPNNLVMWEAIKWFASHGFERLHLGRTSMNNHGLAQFKRGFGAIEDRLNYFRYSLREEKWITSIDRAADSLANSVFRRLPLPVLRLAGRILYPHVS